MKKIILLLITFYSVLSYGQDRLEFEYDNTGNQTIRSLCINCVEIVGKNVHTTKKNKSLNEDENFNLTESIKFYPNPVVEELHLEWNFSDKLVQSVMIFDIQGGLVFEKKVEETDHNEIINFKSLPIGYYIVQLNYSNQTNYNIKIIKK